MPQGEGELRTLVDIQEEFAELIKLRDNAHRVIASVDDKLRGFPPNCNRKERRRLLKLAKRAATKARMKARNG